MLESLARKLPAWPSSASSTAKRRNASRGSNPWERSQSRDAKAPGYRSRDEIYSLGLFSPPRIRSEILAGNLTIPTADRPNGSLG